MSRVATVAVTSKSRARKRHRRNVTLAAVITVALCAGGGGIAYAATRPAATDYRTAVATTGDVTQTVNLTGTVASAKRKDVAFETAGTVDSVAVKVGQTVTAGETLATLKEDSLTAAITSAQQVVTKDEQALASDLATQAGASSSSSTTSSASSSSSSSSISSVSGSGSSAGSGGSSSKASPAVTKATAAVTAAQAALVAQYTVAQTALTATDDLVTASDPACAPFLAATLDDASATPADDLAAAKTALASCQASISGVLDSEKTTDAAQKQLQVLAGDLNTAVTALTKAVGSASNSSAGSSSGSSSGSSTSTSSSTATKATSAASGSGAASGGATVTAATILSDEAAITAAKAQLAVAVHNKEFGTLTSPIAGTVAAVSITTGSSVSAGSTTEVITVIGDDGYVVTSTASLTNVQQVKAGQSVAISVSGSSAKLAGTVSSVGLLNTSTTSTPSYDVTVVVTTEGAKLLNGASAKLAVTADVAKSVLTIPTSALHRTAQTYRVELLKGGKLVAQTVKVGATGSTVSEVTSGLKSGAVVVLADVSSTTIGDSTSTTTGSTGLAGLGGTTTGRGTGTGGPPAGFTRGG
jgi:multidrug efflux pump subunit AcrA (membrane-fusion protein)